MNMRSVWIAVLAVTALIAPVQASAESVSVFPTAPAEPRAVTVEAAGDGQADDSDALQQAFDKSLDATNHGIVFLPSGTYRITRTLVVPPGVRIYGVGPTRPVILLGADTPGFQQGVSTMIVFAGRDQYNVGAVPVPVPTIVPRDKVVRDANSGSFYSSMRNVDIEIGPGNPAAAGVRFRMAQHAFLSHMEFRLGSAFAGVYQAGNVMEDVHFVGGRYGIVSEKTSPAWQFTLLDSTFTGQRDAAIREHEARLTMVNVTIQRHPGRDRDRPRLWRLAVGQGRPLRAGQPRGRGDLEREQRVHPGRLRECARESTARCSRGSATAGGRSRRRQGLSGGVVLLRPGGARSRPDGRLRDGGRYRAALRACRRRASARSARFPRWPSGPTCAASASPATGRPTTPRRSSARSTRTACSIFRSASTRSPTGSRCGRIAC